MFFLPNIEYAGALGRSRVNVLRDDDELLQNVPCCTALISARLDKVSRALLVEAKSATRNIGFIGSAKTL